MFTVLAISVMFTCSVKAQETFCQSVHFYAVQSFLYALQTNSCLLCSDCMFLQLSQCYNALRQYCSQKGAGGLSPPPIPQTKVYVKIAVNLPISSVYYQESNHNCCNQMSYFKAIMHQIPFRLGLCSRLCWGNSQHSTRSSWIFDGFYF